MVRRAGRRVSADADADVNGAIETQARVLLARYGVVFRRLLERETHASPWRSLTAVYRRLEARGEIRGGRFVTGMSGEQFALPEAVERLREVRRGGDDGRFTTISAVDPLNLTGILTIGDRDPRENVESCGLPGRRRAGGARRRLHAAARRNRRGRRRRPRQRPGGPPAPVRHERIRGPVATCSDRRARARTAAPRWGSRQEADRRCCRASRDCPARDGSRRCTKRTDS